MPRKPRKRKLDFELVPQQRKLAGTSKPKPTAHVRRPYVSRSPGASSGRYVHRYSGFVQLETQRAILDDIHYMTVIQGEDSVTVYLHFKDGTKQQL